MKISKLFHWLYAILMFLPVMVFIPNAFYYGFNKEAIAEEKTEQVPVYYESNDINTYEDFIIGNVYSWNDNLVATAQTSINLLNIKMLDIYPSNPYGRLYITSYGNLAFDNGNVITFNSLSFNFIVTSIYQGISSIPNDYLLHFSKCNTNYVKEYQTLTTDMSITDSMSYAWESVWQNDLFSWTYGSFLTQPFLYITDLFNVPSNNTLVYCLSYWLDISIIWLVFDLIMYIPLLVHRWIDKGIIE